MSNNVFWMIVSGATGFTCFVLIHFTKWLRNPVKAAYLQISANTFVFLSWGSAFLAMEGLAKALALCGTIVPVIMASITIYRVFVRKSYATGSGQ